jgi:hypothetical protein
MVQRAASWPLVVAHGIPKPMLGIALAIQCSDGLPHAAISRRAALPRRATGTSLMAPASA